MPTETSPTIRPPETRRGIFARVEPPAQRVERKQASDQQRQGEDERLEGEDLARQPAASKPGHSGSSPTATRRAPVGHAPRGGSLTGVGLLGELRGVGRREVDLV